MEEKIATFGSKPVPRDTIEIIGDGIVLSLNTINLLLIYQLDWQLE